MNKVFKATIASATAVLILAGCSGNNTKEVTYDADSVPKTSMGTIGNHELDFSDIPTYTTKEIEFDFHTTEFSSNITANIPTYTYDASKLENMTIEQKEQILETKETLLKEMVTVFADNNIQAKMDNVSGEVIIMHLAE